MRMHVSKAGRAIYVCEVMWAGFDRPEAMKGELPLVTSGVNSGQQIAL